MGLCVNYGEEIPKNGLERILTDKFKLMECSSDFVTFYGNYNFLGKYLLCEVEYQFEFSRINNCELYFR